MPTGVYVRTQPVSIETRDKLRKSAMGNQHNLGRGMSEETRCKISESNKGQKRSAATCQRISEAQKRNPRSREFYQAMRVKSSGMRGRSHSIEAKAKNAEAHLGNINGKGYVHTPEQRYRQSEAQIGNTNGRGWVPTKE